MHWGFYYTCNMIILINYFFLMPHSTWKIILLCPFVNLRGKLWTSSKIDSSETGSLLTLNINIVKRDILLKRDILEEQRAKPWAMIRGIGTELLTLSQTAERHSECWPALMVRHNECRNWVIPELAYESRPRGKRPTYKEDDVGR